MTRKIWTKVEKILKLSTCWTITINYNLDSLQCQTPQSLQAIWSAIYLVYWPLNPKEILSNKGHISYTFHPELTELSELSIWAHRTHKHEYINKAAITTKQFILPSLIYSCNILLLVADGSACDVFDACRNSTSIIYLKFIQELKTFQNLL